MDKYTFGVAVIQENVFWGALALGLFTIGRDQGRARILANHDAHVLEAVDAAFDVINLNRGEFGLEVSNG